MQLRQIVLKEIGIPAEMDCELISGDFEFSVYRIAHPNDLKGVYCNSHDEKYVDYLAESHGEKKRTPCDHRDRLIFKTINGFDDNVVYGVASLGVLFRWFGRKEMLHLEKLGYKLYKFTSKEIRLYERQCTVPLNTWLKSEKEIVDIKHLVKTYKKPIAFN